MTKHNPYVLTTPARIIQMRFASVSYTINWYDNYATHEAFYDALLDAFAEGFVEELYHIRDATKFVYQTSVDRHLGVELEYEYLHDWSPNWFIHLDLNAHTILARLHFNDWMPKLREKLQRAAENVQHEDRATPRLEFNWCPDTHLLLIEIQWYYNYD